MPTISEFFGISIVIRFIDHNPPHFHAYYQQDKISVEIMNGKVRGEMSERALRMILEWLDLHREEIMNAWKLTSIGQNPSKIEPLK